MPCIALKVIGAIPAHVRIGVLLRSLNPTPTPTPSPGGTATPTPVPTICQDSLEPCGFALPGGPSLYVQGTKALNPDYLGFHDGAWDWWKPGHRPSSEDPTDVLSMLNGTVQEVGRFANGGQGGGTTYLTVSNARWTQTIYHCDMNYVAVNDPVKWGQSLCLMGNQGDSDWTHLHLILRGPDGPVQDQTQWWVP